MCNIRKYVDLCLSILFLASAILGYYKDVSYMTEYCFISGLLTGGIFFISFSRQQIQRKTLPLYIYIACFVDIFIIFIVTVTIRLNLEGAFWFIHIINPVIICIYWFLFCNQREMNWKGIFSVIIFPICYMLFAFILYKSGIKCPFPASLIFMDYHGIVPVIILFILTIMLCVLGYIFHVLNKVVRKKIASNLPI